MFQLATKDNDIRVYLNIDPDLPEFLVGDARRVAQMVNNLVDNAVKFTERGWVHVNVASQLVEGQAHLTISVKDTGIGIAKEKIPIIFEKFQQIDSSMSRKFEGAGLGLSITHWLTHLMGGTISVQSQPGNGSYFVICLALPVSERIVKLQPELSSFQSAMSSGRIG